MQMPSKKTLIIGAALIASHLSAFAVGRFTTPEKVKETEKTAEKAKTIIKSDEKREAELSEQIRLLQTQISEFQKNVKKTEHIVVRPDGSSDTTRTEESSEHKTDKTDTDKTENKHEKVVETKVVEKTITVEKVVTKEKIVDNPKRWRLGPTVMLDFADFSKPRVGGELDYRIAGPFVIGARVNSKVDSFKFSNFNVGVAVSIQF